MINEYQTISIIKLSFNFYSYNSICANYQYFSTTTAHNLYRRTSSILFGIMKGKSRTNWEEGW